MAVDLDASPGVAGQYLLWQAKGRRHRSSAWTIAEFGVGHRRDPPFVYNVADIMALQHAITGEMTMAGEPAMRFVRYAQDGAAKYGVLDGDTVRSATGDPFNGGLTAGAAVGPVASLTLLPPVQPGKIVAIGLNYQSHITADAPGTEKPKTPITFLKPQTSLIGSGAAIQLPPEMKQVEYEAEVGFVIGKRARYVREADAYDYILGLTCANDVSARDVQFSDNQWMRAKGFDTFTPLGPCVAVGLRAEGLKMTGALNGEVRQEASTDDLIFSVPFLVQFLSRFMTLEPGDVVITGTPAGVGKLAPGDTYAITVEGVGTLTNPCVAEDYKY